MISISPLLRFILVVSSIISVNGYPEEETLNGENSIDVPIPTQRNQLLLKKLILLSRHRTTTQDFESDVEELNPQVTNLVTEDEADVIPHPKPRVKRFICWHSCLGPWKKKNPKLRESRHRIKNVDMGESALTDPVEQSDEGGGNGSPKSKRSSLFEIGLGFNGNAITDTKTEARIVKKRVLSKTKNLKKQVKEKKTIKSLLPIDKNKLKDTVDNVLVRLPSEGQDSYDNYASVEDQKEDYGDYEYDTSEIMDRNGTSSTDKRLTTTKAPKKPFTNTQISQEVQPKIIVTPQPIQVTLPITPGFEIQTSTEPMHPNIETTSGLETSTLNASVFKPEGLQTSEIISSTPSTPASALEQPSTTMSSPMEATTLIVPESTSLEMAKFSETSQDSPTVMTSTDPITGTEILDQMITTALLILSTDSSIHPTTEASLTSSLFEDNASLMGSPYTSTDFPSSSYIDDKVTIDAPVLEPDVPLNPTTLETEVVKRSLDEIGLSTSAPTENQEIAEESNKNKEEELRKIEENMRNTHPQKHNKVFGKSMPQLDQLRTRFTHKPRDKNGTTVSTVQLETGNPTPKSDSIDLASEFTDVLDSSELPSE